MGKSTLVSMVGGSLADMGYRVGFLDADLGGANLHHCLGVKRPQVGLQDYLAGRVATLEEAAVQTPVTNTWLISGASDILELANPRFAQKQKVIRNLRKLHADYVLVDLAAGTSTNVSDFFASFDNAVVVTDSLPSSVENAYGFVKNGIIRGLMRLFPGEREAHDHIRRFSDPRAGNAATTLGGLLDRMQSSFPRQTHLMREWLAQRKTYLVLNMVTGRGDIEVGKHFTEIVRKYLAITVYYIGYVVAAPEVRRSMREMKPLVKAFPSSRATHCARAIARNLVALTKGKPSV